MIEYAAGWITIRDTFANPTSSSFVGALMTPLIAFVCVGIYEELITRGYLLRNLAEGLSIGRISAGMALLIAWVFSSGVFGLLHAFNPNATIISTINLTAAGLFLGLGPILTGRLSLAIGLHITWNFFQGHVFGFPVSGFIYHPATLFAIEQQGDSRWTGGKFGPEAGITGLLAMLVGGLIIVLWVFVREGRVSLARQFTQYGGAAT